ncbi:MAG TPA: (2Fe-2S)-binding protein [Gemmatimonadaceae bacterium]|jgi:xanthine dehydrogenase YagT iron-sulfur-binding subunit|nr:(2Fe-2S)-binding protein [Gemmatimonadaceae bacterium]
MRLRVNGAEYALNLPPHATLLEALRDGARLTGTKLVCDRGECGACTVLLDGDPAYACLTLAAACEHREIATIEGVARNGELHPLQRAFMEQDALQCGFCTPGQIMTALALLRANPDPSADDVVRWMSGNLCRCGAYPKIVRAVLDAARRMRHDGQA